MSLAARGAWRPERVLAKTRSGGQAPLAADQSIQTHVQTPPRGAGLLRDGPSGLEEVAADEITRDLRGEVKSPGEASSRVPGPRNHRRSVDCEPPKTSSSSHGAPTTSPTARPSISTRSGTGPAVLVGPTFEDPPRHPRRNRRASRRTAWSRRCRVRTGIVGTTPGRCSPKGWRAFSPRAGSPPR